MDVPIELTSFTHGSAAMFEEMRPEALERLKEIAGRWR
jgi:hypothetical protein